MALVGAPENIGTGQTPATTHGGINTVGNNILRRQLTRSSDDFLKMVTLHQHRQKIIRLQ